MTGKEKIQAAFSKGGTDEFAVVIPYEGIYIRDHWAKLTGRPWWHSEAPDLDMQVRWRREIASRSRYDWFDLPGFPTREAVANTRIDERPDGAYRVDTRTGEARRIVQPPPGGWMIRGEPDRLIETFDELDRVLPEAPAPDPSGVLTDGRGDLALRMQRESPDQYPIRSVDSPLWSCYGLWGFEGMMTMTATHPDFVRIACDRYSQRGIQAIREAAALGAEGIWIEECLTDQVSPSAYSDLCLPYVRRLVEEIGSSGMASIHYYCGDPSDRLHLLLETGADALSLEEGKKGFEIDIEEIAHRAGGRCALLGNLDAVGVLQDGDEELLRAEIDRQVAAGRANGDRFVMSLGSPVTPGTSVERVRLYCDLAREAGSRR